MNEITLRATFGAAAAPGVTLVGQYTEPVRAAGPTLMVQAIGAGASITVQGSNLPGLAGAWVDVADVAAGVPEQVECLYGYVRVGATAPCDVGVSGVHGTASAGGGGGGGVVGGALEATQQSVLVALQSIDAGTPSAPLVQPVTDAQLRAVPSDITLDSAGVAFSPSACSHAYAYDGSGNLVTDTATLGAVVRVKTLTWSSGSITAETKWVVQ
jgi:YD repeat-containing protein